MTRVLAARLKKLEARNEPPKRLHNSVVYFDPTTDRVLTSLPHAKKIMLVPHWPSEDAWAEAAIAQQTQLINSAA